MSFSNWCENKVLDHVVKRTDYVTTVVLIGLCTANPGETATGASCNEVADDYGYERKNTGAYDWSSAAAGSIYNVNELAFPEATGSWGTVTHFVLVNDPLYGSGDVILYGELASPKVIAAGSVPRFEVGAIGASLT